MQLKPITAIVVLLLLVATLSVSGCTLGVPGTSSPTPTAAPVTPTPVVDYSSILTNNTESGNFIMERPYTRSVNERGNDVYKGVGRNATLPGSKSVTLVTELTKSETVAKQVYDKAVNEKINAGYTPNTESAARIKTNDPWTTGAWVGTSGVNVFICTYYYYYSSVNSWVVEQQSFVIS